MTNPDPALVGEIVPLTDEERIEVARIHSAWAAVAGNPQVDLMPALQNDRLTLNRILSTHGFDPSSTSLTWSENAELVLRARRLPKVPIEDSPEFN